MRKSGLHKQISSIFEGAPAPDNTVDNSRSVMRRIADDDASAQPTAVPSVAVSTPRGGSFHPDRVVPRPKPAPKVQMAEASALLKKNTRSAAKKKTADTPSAKSRQKMMTVLVGVLSLVFVGVMVVSFGGIGQTNPVPAQTAAPAASPKTESRCDPESWVFPEPLPAQMRNPLVIPKPIPVATPEDAEAVEVALIPQLSVRGIVYSDKKPSAIIDDTIVLEGQSVNGVKVVKVTRDAVEFEKDGKRWTQGVQ